jgi:AcrR family transcriptional regulator
MAELPGIAPQFSDKQLAQRAAILRACRTLMADEGRSGMTLAYVARLIWIPAAAIRQHFINLDSVLFEILLSHLQAISKAMANIPPDAPDIYAARRKAYLAYTRTPWGALTEDHVLLTRDVFTLRPQDHQVLWDLHRGLGQLLGGDRPESTLQLLDFPGLDRQEIEDILAKRTASHAARREAHQAAVASREAAGEARQGEPEAPISHTTNAHTAAAQPTQAATQTQPAETRPEPAAQPHASPHPEPAQDAAAPDMPPKAKTPYKSRIIRPAVQKNPDRPIIGIASRIRKPYPPRPTLLQPPRPPGQMSPTPEPNPYPSLIERVMRSQKTASGGSG